MYIKATEKQRKDFSNKLKELMEIYGFTVTSLIKEMEEICKGYSVPPPSRSTVIAWRKNHLPSSKYREPLADVLHISPDDLYSENEKMVVTQGDSNISDLRYEIYKEDLFNFDGKPIWLSASYSGLSGRWSLVNYKDKFLITKSGYRIPFDNIQEKMYSNYEPGELPLHFDSKDSVIKNLNQAMELDRVWLEPLSMFFSQEFINAYVGVYSYNNRSHSFVKVDKSFDFPSSGFGSRYRLYQLEDSKKKKKKV